MTTHPTWHFARMQKTAGDSFLNHIRLLFPDEAVCPHYFEHELVAGPDPRKWQVFVGHISPSALLEYFSSVNLILMLRDPAERLISAYYYWHEHAPKVAPHSEFFAQIRNMSFLEFLTDESPLIRNAVFNAQARMLAGGRFGASNHTRTGIVGPLLSEKAIVCAAQETIDSAFFVGLTESFSESVARLLSTMGHPPTDEILKKNIGQSRREKSELAPDVLDALEKNSALDRVVYDLARARFLTGRT